MCLAIPGKITDIYQKNSLRMAKIDFGGIVKEICLEYTPEAEVGDYALIHVGGVFKTNLFDDPTEVNLCHAEGIFLIDAGDFSRDGEAHNLPFACHCERIETNEAKQSSTLRGDCFARYRSLAMTCIAIAT